jgi:hypothetical protein
MASPAYLQFQTVINAIKHELNKYLTTAGYKTYSTEEAEELLQKYKGSVSAPHPAIKNTVIFLPASSFRDNKLTLDRILNVVRILHEVEQSFYAVNKTSLEIKDDDMRSKSFALYQKLSNALVENNNISTAHKKYHCSARQSASMKLGFFATWWNKTWRVSRAGTALENSLDKLKGSLPSSLSKSQRM